jgi:hypothetical protein
LRLRGADRHYCAMHRRLLERCRSLAKAEPDRDRQRFFESLEELARPWLSLSVLAQTERKIVADLLNCCYRLERQMGGRTGLPRVPRWLLLPTASLAAAGAYFFLPGVSRLAAPVVNWLLGLFQTFSLLYGGTTTGQRLLAAGIVLILTAILAVLHAKLS